MDITNFLILYIVGMKNKCKSYKIHIYQYTYIYRKQVQNDRTPLLGNASCIFFKIN